MFHLFKCVDAVFVHFTEVVKFSLQAAEIFGFLNDLGSDVVTIVVEHDFFEQLTLLRLVLHKDDTKLDKLVFRHSFNSLLNNS